MFYRLNQLLPSSQTLPFFVGGCMLPCGPGHFRLISEGKSDSVPEEALGISRVMRSRAGLTYQSVRLSLAGGSGRREGSVVSLERAGPGVGGGVVLPLSVSVGRALELL